MLPLEVYIFVSKNLEMFPDLCGQKSKRFTHGWINSLSFFTAHSPPKTYLDGSPIAGVYPSGQMDLLLEMDKVVGSLVQQLNDRNLLNDTIVIFTSDNG